jgi:uncharacterized protein
MTTFSKAFITGATSGIGWELANLLAAKKIPLLITGRNKSMLEKLQKIWENQTSISIFPADLASSHDLQMIGEVIEKEKPSLFINNAGLGFYGETFNIPWEEQKLMIDVNITSLLKLSIIWSKMVLSEKKEGTLVNVSSIAGEIPAPGMAVYAATKAFVTHFSKALDTELAPFGIRVLVSAPGQVATDFADRAAKKKVRIKQPGMSAQKAAKLIWRQIEKGKPFYLFDYKVRLYYLLSRCFPEKLIKNIIYSTIKKRLGSNEFKR